MTNCTFCHGNVFVQLEGNRQLKIKEVDADGAVRKRGKFRTKHNYSYFLFQNTSKKTKPKVDFRTLVFKF